MKDMLLNGYVFELVFDDVRVNKVMGMGNLLTFETTREHYKEYGSSKTFGYYDMDKQVLTLNDVVMTDEQREAIKVFCGLIRRLKRPEEDIADNMISKQRKQPEEVLEACYVKMPYRRADD